MKLSERQTQHCSEGLENVFYYSLGDVENGCVLGEPEQPVGRGQSRGDSGCDSPAWTSQRQSLSRVFLIVGVVLLNFYFPSCSAEILASFLGP